MTRYSIPEITARLRQSSDSISENAATMPEARFFAGTDEDWSAANYLKHLILVVKPFAKGLTMPREVLVRMFGTSAAPSRSYDEVVEQYRAVLATGLGAQNVPGVMPTGYRMPEGVTDERAYLVETWQDAVQRVFTALDSWTEDELDHYQMLHPAIRKATIREMLYFNIYHNEIHRDDIARLA